jgi:hypothetical protein
VVVKLVVCNFVCSLDNRISNLGIKTKFDVGLSSALLEQAKRANDWQRHSLAFASNLEVHQ